MIEMRAATALAPQVEIKLDELPDEDELYAGAGGGASDEPAAAAGATGVGNARTGAAAEADAMAGKLDVLMLAAFEYMAAAARGAAPSEPSRPGAGLSVRRSRSCVVHACPAGRARDACVRACATGDADCAWRCAVRATARNIRALRPQHAPVQVRVPRSAAPRARSRVVACMRVSRMRMQVRPVPLVRRCVALSAPRRRICRLAAEPDALSVGPRAAGRRVRRVSTSLGRALVTVS